jgi:hypothetical protein
MHAAEVFIVHLWPADGVRRDFRATVQRAGSDESQWFTQPEAMVRFLEQQASAPVNPDDNPSASEQPRKQR